MKSYLSLIPISAKAHGRQNRMTILCITFSVFLVTAVFSMAEMGIRMESQRLFDKHVDLSLQGIISSAMGHTLLTTAMVLSVLILMAGILMISGSINSNVAQRTTFFGMMRCIGMSKGQIKRFVRLEALNWCKTAIPLGTISGIVTTWGLCAILRFLVGNEFATIPIFGISIIGIIFGVLVGIITVLIAAQAPAKRASNVSPITAASGNTQDLHIKNQVKGLHFLRVETALGIHHATAGKKNLLLMTGSFALSIILFLSFSVMIDLVGFIMPQSVNTPDLSIASKDGLNSINSTWVEELRVMPGMEQVFGRRSALGLLAKVKDKGALVDMISYDDFDLDALAKDKLLQKGGDLSKVYGDQPYVLAIGDEEAHLKIGDTIMIGDQSLTIAGLLKYNPFSEDGGSHGVITLITSGDTYTRLTGVADYTLVMVKTTKDVAEENIKAIENTVPSNAVLSDCRDQQTASTYMAFIVFVYGFLAIITAVTVLNIMNSISMSVSARIKQYGAMRAVGMDVKQIVKMITAEALTYATLGCGVGCGLGLIISNRLYGLLITTHYSYAHWQFPIIPIAIILLVVLLVTLASVYAPAKRISTMAITETINER